MQEICLFYTDGGNESERAKRVLDENGIVYCPIDLRNFNSADVSPPRLVSNLGRFDGIERILEYSTQFGSVSRFDKDFEYAVSGAVDVYVGKWIAVQDCKVIESSKSYEDLISVLGKRDAKASVIRFVEGSDIS